jgi:hypothetical protein
LLLTTTPEHFQPQTLTVAISSRLTNNSNMMAPKKGIAVSYRFHHRGRRTQGNRRIAQGCAVSFNT